MADVTQLEAVAASTVPTPQKLRHQGICSSYFQPLLHTEGMKQGETLLKLAKEQPIEKLPSIKSVDAVRAAKWRRNQHKQCNETKQ